MYPPSLPLPRSLRLLPAAVLLAAFPTLARAERPRPNILIIVADDLGYADVGFNGGKKIATPQLDRLAATGVKLTDFRACPVCSPTRAGLMTGRWPLRFGMMRSVVPPWSKYGLPPEEQTLPELLAKAGYERRGLVGKWHLGHASPKFLPLQQGFTRFKGHYNGAIDYFTHEREGEVDWHDDGETVREEGYSTDLLAEAAVRFIRESPRGKPWFLYVAFNAPHTPLEAKPETLEKYASIKNEEHRTYAAMVDALDQGVGSILETVESLPDARNTLVLFFSDNGGIPKVGSSNRPFRGGKHTVYEGGIRVCAAIRWPAAGLEGGGEFAGRIGYIDALPTMLRAAGSSIPENVDGLDFLPALRGQGKLPERPWFSYVAMDKEALGAVNLGPWKLVARGDISPPRAAGDPGIELYDLSSDIAEKTNLAAKHPERVNDLLRRLRDFEKLQKPGVDKYSEGRAGYKAPKDWIIR